MQTSKFFRTLRVGMLVALGVSSLPQTALASEVFPAVIQEAAGMPCTPSCLLCHTSNPGTILTYQGKPFGKAMKDYGVSIRQEGTVRTAFTKFAAANPAAAEGLKLGLDPDDGTSLCGGPTYGCGAHVAKDAPRDDWSGLLFVAGAMGFGALLRRTKRR
jgi:hypothetical protein